MKTKRFLSILLSLVLVLGMLTGMSLTASAAGNTTEITPTNTSGNMTITLTIKAAQTITASDVTATYGDTDKSVSASVTTPATGGGAISYAVKTGSEDYIDVAADGKLTIKKVPPTDGKAYVIVKAAGTDDYAETTKEVTVTISPAEVTVTAKDQSIYVGGTVPTLEGEDFYTVTGLVGEDTLMTAPTLAYQKDGNAATPDNTTAGTYDIVASGATASDNYTITYANGTLTISDKGTQTITADDVTVTYGDTDKKVSASVTDPTEGGGAISYAVKEGSGDYIDVDATTGALTIKKVPADGKAYVVVTAAGTATYEQATKDVTVTINKANSTVTKAPEAKTLTYNGQAQALVTAGEATGGTMQYALGTATEATQPYTTSIPTGIDSGTYYVWYKAVGDGNHNDSEARCVEAAIGSVDSNTAAPTEQTLTYDGSAQPLVKPGSVDYGTLFYALGSNDTTAPTDGWSTEVPTATSAGTYYVWYKVKGDGNHNDVPPACIVVTIGEAAAPAVAAVPNPSGMVIATMVSEGKTSLKLTWTTAEGVSGYDVFLKKCKKKGDYPLVGSVEGGSVNTYTATGLKKGVAYTAYVKAWVMQNGGKVYVLNQSPTVYAYTNKGTNKVTNPAKVKVKKAALTVKVGKSKKIKASVKGVKKGKKIIRKVRKLRYISNDPAIATVTRKGRVKGKSAGTCVIYVLANNGKYKTVTVTVK